MLISLDCADVGGIPLNCGYLEKSTHPTLTHT